MGASPSAPQRYNRQELQDLAKLDSMRGNPVGPLPLRSTVQGVGVNRGAGLRLVWPMTGGSGGRPPEPRARRLDGVSASESQ